MNELEKMHQSALWQLAAVTKGQLYAFIYLSIFILSLIHNLYKCFYQSSKKKLVLTISIMYSELDRDWVKDWIRKSEGGMASSLWSLECQ